MVRWWYRKGNTGDLHTCRASTLLYAFTRSSLQLRPASNSSATRSSSRPPRTRTRRQSQSTSLRTAFYDFATFAPVDGTRPALHPSRTSASTRSRCTSAGGTVHSLRAKGATTTELCVQKFPVRLRISTQTVLRRGPCTSTTARASRKRKRRARNWPIMRRVG